MATFQNIIEKHFTDAEKQQLSTLLDQVEALLQPKLQNLNEEENVQYGSINEQNKLFVNKVGDYRNSQSNLSSPDVDWDEFFADAADRLFLETGATRIAALNKAMLETKRLHDYDNYQNSLVDYSFTKYKAGLEPGSGFDAKAEDIKQFFPRTGTSGGGSEEPGIGPAPGVPEP